MNFRQPEAGPMAEATDLLYQLNQQSRSLFQERQVILSFSGFLRKLRECPSHLIRNSAQYLYDTFNHFGRTEPGNGLEDFARWKVFDLGTHKNVPIIGSEGVQDEIFKVITGFVRQGYSNKLIMLHGPNGSAKTSIIESIGHAMQRYSETEEGAVYRFNWIFPTDKSLTSKAMGAVGPIGFSGIQGEDSSVREDSFAFLDESKIASKIHSEYKENPIFLIPMPQRAIWLKQWISEETGVPESEVEIPQHILLSGLSKRNQLIWENLLAAYDGDLAKVLRHVQVERFFFSKQYRVGIGTVEPQMSIDAYEKQLTIDRNIANLPPVLHNISFHEAEGPLVEANRGILEFSDMLKRPIEAFKYLLTTVEKGSVNLPSSTTHVDVVFFASTNEKHLDAFKTIPDFASFRSRFELVTAPYLLKPSLEQQIYAQDMKALGKSKPVAPHALEMLCLWAVMTRLKQPNPDYYDSKYRALIARLDPRHKIKLYEGETLLPLFKPQEEATLRELRRAILDEYQNVVAYEGRFGASPREVRSILYRAVQNTKHTTLTPLALFDELDRLVKDRTVYEFLQLEPRGKYHQPQEFILVCKRDFADVFEKEVTASMTLVDEEQYETLLSRYIENVVAQVKREKLYNKITGNYEQPNENLMRDLERILKVNGPIEKHREALLGRIAAFKIDNPTAAIVVSKIFHEYMDTIKQHYYEEQKKQVDDNFKAMLVLGTDEAKNFKEEDLVLAETTYRNLEKRFGYPREAAFESLKFLLTFRTQLTVS
jgi:serine protein kinase